VKAVDSELAINGLLAQRLRGYFSCSGTENTEFFKRCPHACGGEPKIAPLAFYYLVVSTRVGLNPSFKNAGQDKNFSKAS
jgi:hypothetical protein